MKLYKNYIDGKWLESESKDIIQVDDPATGKIIGEISCAKKNEVDLAVSAAKAAFNSRVLVDMPLLERAKLMHRIADETRKIQIEEVNRAKEIERENLKNIEERRLSHSSEQENLEQEKKDQS